MSPSSAVRAPIRCTTRSWSPSKRERSPTTTATRPASSSSTPCACGWRPSATDGLLRPADRLDGLLGHLAVGISAANVLGEEASLGARADEGLVGLPRSPAIGVEVAVDEGDEQG